MKTPKNIIRITTTHYSRMILLVEMVVEIYISVIQIIDISSLVVFVEGQLVSILIGYWETTMTMLMFGQMLVLLFLFQIPADFPQLLPGRGEARRELLLLLLLLLLRQARAQEAGGDFPLRRRPWRGQPGGGQHSARHINKGEAGRLFPALALADIAQHLQFLH